MFNIHFVSFPLLALCATVGIIFCIGKAARSNRTRPDGKIRSTTERKIFTPKWYAGIGRIVTAGYFRSKISP